MADKRPFAKIDTGYILNPKWFQVERAIRFDERIDERIDIRSVVRVAREAHIASILYCAQNVTDGLFPVDVIKSLTVVRPHEEPAITALFEVGLWINEKGGLARVHDYLKHQTSSDKIKQLSDAGKKAASAREAQKTSNRSSNRSSEEKRREEKEVRPKSRPAATTLPDDWEPKDRHHDKAKDEHLHLETEAEKFRNYALANGKKYVQWDRAFDNWLINAKQYAPQGQQSSNQQADRRKRVPIA